MAKAEPSKLNLILPRGTAIYPKLNKPDTKFDAAGVFDTKVAISADASDGVIGKELVNLETVLERLTALRDEFVEAKRQELAASSDPKNKAKAKNLKVKDIGEPGLDDDGNENGSHVFKAKMKASGVKKDGSPWTRKPLLFDAKNKKLADNSPPIYGGSVIKVAVSAMPYYAATDNAIGVTLYLEAVQVIELVSAGGNKSGAGFGFGVEDGYEAEAPDENTPFSDDSAGSGDPDQF